ncbi:carboxypeptidase regulatory-like domain-containing protein [Glycomyces buryatensis]|uniref:Carboxypeptidase regulatory-like domain-containing protein n=1 Tax=Glycomyces buryatensis TaxID=2570927 RepID=A0A4S8QEW3_9ACTN|nr:carboxypeptidase regulatory-like domain-containing protein [Glycomyces buryatensis]THV43187.1 carboxypeptidase regulatory-like domain-containing protein [Glycomyces buryatensis]
MTRSEYDGQGESGPLDSCDRRIMTVIDALHKRDDPIPEDLDERVLFALELEAELDARVASISQNDLVLVRGEADLAVGQGDPASITFDCETVTVMVTPRPAATGEVRLDGWIGPEGTYEVEIRSPEGTKRASSDETGRFVLEALPHGQMFQLVIRPDEVLQREGLPAVVVTPAVRL